MFFGANYFGISFGTSFRSFQLKMQHLHTMPQKHLFLEHIRNCDHSKWAPQQTRMGKESTAATTGTDRTPWVLS